ncbi:hypothetical protein [Nostoc sp. GT001]|nr:hypothetical protein [Nostoc sp. GT001]MDM9581063.1 hypothetical protein [Nostoc sp. GT001]
MSISTIKRSLTLDELVERIKEAIELCLEFEEEQQDSLDFVGIQRVAVEI